MQKKVESRTMRSVMSRVRKVRIRSSTSGRYSRLLWKFAGSSMGEVRIQLSLVAQKLKSVLNSRSSDGNGNQAASRCTLLRSSYCRACSACITLTSLATFLATCASTSATPASNPL